MKIIPTRMRFKGERDYLHGADIYEVLVRELIDPALPATRSCLRLSISQFSRRQLDIYLIEPGDDSGEFEAATAEFNLVAGERTLTGRLVQTSRAVDSRYPFNEEAIYAHCAIEEKRIRIGGDSGCKPVEVAVAMTKRLHQTSLPLTDKRWVLARLQLSRLFIPSDAKGMTITLDHVLGNRFTRSVIAAPTGVVGQIFFAAAPNP